MDTPPLSIASSDFPTEQRSKANSQQPLGNALRNALAQDGRYSPPSSGTSTPNSDIVTKTRRYLLATADDEEIRQILLARCQESDTKQRARMRDIIFTKRFSTFDRQNPLSAESPFHGFFTLFWLAITLLLFKVAGDNWRIYGNPLGRAEVLHVMLDRDVLVLGITDAVMVGSTIVGVALQKLVASDWVSWRRTGWIFQNLWQAASLFAIVAWTYYRDWPWTHTIFIVLHTLTFMMKQHSYAFYNGYRKYKADVPIGSH
jgi:sterol O-acyltransferase